MDALTESGNHKHARNFCYNQDCEADNHNCTLTSQLATVSCTQSLSPALLLCGRRPGPFQRINPSLQLLNHGSCIPAGRGKAERHSVSKPKPRTGCHAGRRPSAPSLRAMHDHNATTQLQQGTTQVSFHSRCLTIVPDLCPLCQGGKGLPDNQLVVKGKARGLCNREPLRSCCIILLTAKTDKAQQ